MKNIKTSYNFDNNSLKVVFSEVIVVNRVEETEDFNLEDFEEGEKVFQLTIKQKNTAINSVTLVTESVANEFQSQLDEYLDYRLDICSNNDEAFAALMRDTNKFFTQMEERVESTLDKIVEKANQEINEIVKNSTHILDDNRTYNKSISQELNKLKKLTQLIENFVIEDDEVVVDKKNEEEGEMLLKSEE